MRLSRILRSNDPSPDDERIPLRSVLLWTVVALAILVGVILYFKYERSLIPIVG